LTTGFSSIPRPESSLPWRPPPPFGLPGVGVVEREMDAGEEDEDDLDEVERRGFASLSSRGTRT
jgi:hypothetical protein